MTAKLIKTREVPKTDYIIYLRRAKEFYGDMHKALETEHWGTVGLLAVHGVISLCDALLVLNLGKRSIGEDHQQVVELFARLSLKGADAQTANLARIISKKNAVAYDGRDFRKSESLEIAKQVDRFFQWGLAQFPSLAH
jgi:hypothetical protein